MSRDEARFARYERERAARAAALARAERRPWLIRLLAAFGELVDEYVGGRR